jgi:hypothetical protein
MRSTGCAKKPVMPREVRSASGHRAPSRRQRTPTKLEAWRKKGRVVGGRRRAEGRPAQHPGHYGAVRGRWSPVSESKARKRRPVEPGGPQDREFHLQRVFATFTTDISPDGAKRLVELLGEYRAEDEGELPE